MSDKKESWTGCIVKIIIIAFVISFLTDWNFITVLLGIIGGLGGLIVIALLWVLSLIILGIVCAIIGSVTAIIIDLCKGNKFSDWKNSAGLGASGGVIGGFVLALFSMILDSIGIVQEETIKSYLIIILIIGAIIGGFISKWKD